LRDQPADASLDVETVADERGFSLADLVGVLGEMLVGGGSTGSQTVRVFAIQDPSFAVLTHDWSTAAEAGADMARIRSDLREMNLATFLHHHLPDEEVIDILRYFES
jgi:hypothetical protein